MMQDEQLEAIDSNQFMTIGIADDAGAPWVSPVWYAPVESREFSWVSDPAARHPRNIAGRPQVAMLPMGTCAAPRDQPATSVATRRSTALLTYELLQRIYGRERVREPTLAHARTGHLAPGLLVAMREERVGA